MIAESDDGIMIGGIVTEAGTETTVMKKVLKIFDELISFFIYALRESAQHIAHLLSTVFLRNLSQ